MRAGRRWSAAPARRCGAAALSGALALLGGCAAPAQVQTLATGRSDVSAYQLNGNDLEDLRQQAGRLCPLGGDIVRQSSQGAPVPAPADGRIGRALQATAGWLDPPSRVAQLVVVCRDPGDRQRLAPAVLRAQPERKPLPAPTPTVRPTVPDVAELGSTGQEPPASLSVALPVGPVMPTW